MKVEFFLKVVVVFGLILVDLAAPLAAKEPALKVCVNFGCKRQQEVVLSQKDWQQLGQLFAKKPANAFDERERIAKAIGWLETWVGQQTGTASDKARNNGAGEAGQLDCISESTNSDRYLRLMEERAWLRFHRVKPRVRRAPFFFDSHWTAVIETLDTKESFAVDSWFFANGHPASIQPLKDWYSKKDPDSGS